jgi:hypothetical protein
MLTGVHRDVRVPADVPGGAGEVASGPRGGTRAEPWSPRHRTHVLRRTAPRAAAAASVVAWFLPRGQWLEDGAGR